MPGGSDNKWVPPVLYRNRKARYGLGAGLLAVVLAVVLIFFNPLAAEELPEGWGVRPEKEILQAELAVPKDYRRFQESPTDETRVSFRDPSGVFGIFMERVQKLPDNEVLAAAPNAFEAYYKGGGENATEMKDAKYREADASFEGSGKAFENIVDFTDYTDSSEVPIRYRYHELVVPGEDGLHWRLRVSMPAEGNAVTDGEELFSDLVEHLVIESDQLA